MLIEKAHQIWMVLREEHGIETLEWVLIGGLITLAYAIYRKDPVFISGQGIGTFVYLRNLILIHRADQAKGPARPSSQQT